MNAIFRERGGRNERAAFFRPSIAASERLSEERGAGVGGERTHLDKCTIWHCSRENRRPCARAAPPLAPTNHKPSRHSLRPFWREPLVWSERRCRLARIASASAISAWRPLRSLLIMIANIWACGFNCLTTTLFAAHRSLIHSITRIMGVSARYCVSIS